MKGIGKNPFPSYPKSCWNCFIKHFVYEDVGVLIAEMFENLSDNITFIEKAHRGSDIDATLYLLEWGGGRHALLRTAHLFLLCGRVGGAGSGARVSPFVRPVFCDFLEFPFINLIKMGERLKIMFSLRAPNSEKHKHLGTFLEPKTPKIAFSTFGPTFPFWSVSGAQSTPEAKNQHISGFSSQKWKKAFLRFWSKKGAQNVTFIKGFTLVVELCEMHIFHFLT